MKLLVFIAATILSISAFAAPFSFAGHMTVKNDLPEPLQITIFEGDLQQVPDDEDTVAFKKQLADIKMELESELFYSTKNEGIHLIVFMAKVEGISSVVIMDMQEKSRNIYAVNERAEKRLVIGRVSYQSDLILEIK